MIAAGPASESNRIDGGGRRVSLAAGFEALFSSIPDDAGTRRETYLIAHHGLRIHYAHAELAARLSPGLAHARVEQRTLVGLSIHAMDGSALSRQHPGLDLGSMSPASALETHPVVYHDDPPYQAVHRVKSDVFCILDRCRQRAIYWVPNADSVPIEERDRPFREILSWWLGGLGCQVIHASATANAHGAVLMVGASGSGKSATALGCLSTGMEYLGDEYVLGALDPSPIAFTLYSSGRASTQEVKMLAGS